MTRYEQVKADLQANPKTWLITGVAGFIGSNLLETLLKLDQSVVGLDNFATGHQYNLDEVQTFVSEEQWARFRFIEGDIRNLDHCREAVKGTDYVLHQAALGSVPRSIEDPIATNQANIDGFLNMLVAAKDEIIDWPKGMRRYGAHFPRHRQRSAAVADDNCAEPRTTGDTLRSDTAHRPSRERL